MTTTEQQNLEMYDYLKKKISYGSVTMHNPFNRGYLSKLVSCFVSGRGLYVLKDVDDDLDKTGKKKKKKKDVNVVKMTSSSSKKMDEQ